MIMNYCPIIRSIGLSRFIEARSNKGLITHRQGQQFAKYDSTDKMAETFLNACLYISVIFIHFNILVAWIMTR